MKRSIAEGIIDYAARAEVGSLLATLTERERELSSIRVDLATTDKHVNRLQRYCANWERKYDRVRRLLDPAGVLPEGRFSLVAVAASAHAALCVLLLNVPEEVRYLAARAASAAAERAMKEVRA